MQKPSGFTLVELSIVLVIIALLVTALLGTVTMVRNAQMRATISDLQNYQHALKQFSDKYNELPGDMYDATNFWGVNPGGCPAPASTAPQTGTCNGHSATVRPTAGYDAAAGDGKIAPRDFDNGAPATDFTETFLAWQQLYDAGMISQAMTGTQGPTGSMDAQPGLNVPQGYQPNVGYMLYYLRCTGFSDSGASSNTCTNAYFPAQYGHILEVGMRGGAANDYTHNPAFTTQEAATADTKIDDGQPGSGKLLVPVTEGTCATSASSYSTGTNSDTAVCSLIYITGQ